jgi:hypothetical protein
MKLMKDRKIIMTGLVVFCIMLTFPFWYNRGKAAPAPVLELTEKAKAAMREYTSTARARNLR